MTPSTFLPKAIQAAEESGHIWPEYAACEAALESAWGESQLAKKGNNLFGEKNPKGSGYPTMELPTFEFINGQRIRTTAIWPCFPDWRTSFVERMNVLRRLAPFFPHYGNALAAPDGETFVIEVSKTWATDPDRAAKVLQIHNKHFPK
jgi:flagellum-specific peptidoglycan hydrolase FlgJ